MNKEHKSVSVWMNNTLKILTEGEKPSKDYLCHLCGNQYSCSYTLSRHIDLKHELDYILQCPRCFHSTNRRDHMHRHYRLVHKLNQPFPEALKMPLAPEHSSNKKKTSAEPEASTSTAVPEPQVSITVEYEKFPDSTGAYLYYSTLRPGQKPFNWVPTTIDINETEAPSYSQNDTEYPRLEVQQHTRYIPLFTETLEEDEVPTDPRRSQSKESIDLAAELQNAVEAITDEDVAQLDAIVESFIYDNAREDTIDDIPTDLDVFREN